MTIDIPDWIFDWILCGPFWLGFGTAILIAVVFILWALSKMTPW